MYETATTFSLIGLRPERIRVEASIRRGTPMLLIVGLAPRDARECRERVRSASTRAGLRLPGLRITVNLAPADLPKAGAGFDLPVVVAALAAAGRIEKPRLAGTALVGELGLDGHVRPVRGVLPMCLECAGQPDLHTLIVPEANLAEAAGVEGVTVLGASSLTAVADHFAGRVRLPRPRRGRLRRQAIHPDLSDVHGRAGARRALEIAAAGGHHLLLIGEPGAGKTMLATRLAGLLPELTPGESREVTVVYSAAGLLAPGESLMTEPPLRAPHHTVTAAGLLGGGSRLRPGEVSLAHHGVLFLDELGEFRPAVIESLRQPLESGSVRLARGHGAVTLPGKFQLVAAMNGCPCGYAASADTRCVCGPWLVRRYLRKLSGPLLDRIGITCEVSGVEPDAMSPEGAEPSAVVRSRVAAANAFRRRRGQSLRDADLAAGELTQHCRLDDEAASILVRASRRFRLSARACHHVQRVARTIADLSAQSDIPAGAVGEALTYRRRLPN